MTGRLIGKVALISGGAGGLGIDQARTFLREGARVVLADMDEETGERSAGELGDRARFIRLDVTDALSWRAAVDFTESEFGSLSILVNGAGIVNGGRLGEYSESDWRRVIDINLTGTFLGISAAVDALNRARPASVVNMSSVAGMEGASGIHAYTASKFGVRGLTKSAAMELAERGIRVNSVHPGTIRTPMTVDRVTSAQWNAGGDNPLQRLGDPQEVSNLVLFLASDESSYCNGAEFVIDGGLTAGSVGPRRSDSRYATPEA